MLAGAVVVPAADDRQPLGTNAVAFCIAMRMHAPGYVEQANRDSWAATRVIRPPD